MPLFGVSFLKVLPAKLFFPSDICDVLVSGGSPEVGSKMASRCIHEISFFVKLIAKITFPWLSKPFPTPSLYSVEAMRFAVPRYISTGDKKVGGAGDPFLFGGTVESLVFV